MVLLLASVAACARWRTIASAKAAEGLTFEEEYPPELFALNLLQNVGVPLKSSDPVTHS